MALRRAGLLMVLYTPLTDRIQPGRGGRPAGRARMRGVHRICRRGRGRRFYRFFTHAAMSSITSLATCPAIWYSPGVPLPLPSMNRWFSAG